MFPIENQQAPNFTLQDQNGNNHSLSQYKGKWMHIYNIKLIAYVYGAVIYPLDMI